MKIQISVSSKALTQKQLKLLVVEAVNKSRHAVQLLEKQKQNPSVSSSYYQAVGRLEALEAIVDAMSGNVVGLRLLTE